METLDERLWVMIRARAELDRYVEEGIHTDEETQEARQVIEEEIGELRIKIADRHFWGSAVEKAVRQMERVSLKNRREEMLLEMTREYIRKIAVNRKKPLEMVEDKWTEKILEKMSVALPYFQAYKYGQIWYIAASREAVNEVKRRFEDKLQHHIKRERELICALDYMEKLEKNRW